MRYPFEHLKEHLRESHGCDRGREERHFRGRGPFAGPFGPFGEGERHSWRGRGPGRIFASADLRFLLLDLIAEKPRHGYELIKAIEEKLGGAYSPSPGIIYPMLTLLEETGLATVTAEGTRKLYSITEEGKKELAENRSIVDEILARMAAVGSAARPTERDPQIMRAIQNFRMVLTMRAGNLTPEQRSRIVEIIDNAAREIEKA
ncbi:MAG TPA: PadR family transcriptional regulator [Acidobacteriaceae bacterium]|jgi:DNA-binding PadR family transcriptional regulator